ncbi:MAG: hypothetical protein M0Z95_09015 [Actinomycetota bacterium]|jgi:hypothetical protein|nr:hypothetical protein [Actinomycetota bacterium]
MSRSPKINAPRLFTEAGHVLTGTQDTSGSDDRPASQGRELAAQEMPLRTAHGDVPASTDLDRHRGTVEPATHGGSAVVPHDISPGSQLSGVHSKCPRHRKLAWTPRNADEAIVEEAQFELPFGEQAMCPEKRPIPIPIFDGQRRHKTAGRPGRGRTSGRPALAPGVQRHLDGMAHDRVGRSKSETMHFSNGEHRFQRGTA